MCCMENKIFRFSFISWAKPQAKDNTASKLNLSSFPLIEGLETASKNIIIDLFICGKSLSWRI